jgi:glycosyltransferase involved in cell wall biosynthesis
LLGVRVDARQHASTAHASAYRGFPAQVTLPVANRAEVSDAEGVSVIIPVFNGEATITEVVDRIGDVLGDVPHEIILVNDGSTDQSWQRIIELSDNRPSVRGVNLARNYGQHNALLAGIRNAIYAITVTLDDDLQNPPEEMPKLLERLKAGNDVVYGAFSEQHYGLLRSLGTRLAKSALRTIIGPIAEDVSAYRAFRTDLRAAFASFQGPYVSVDVLLSWAASRYDSVPVEHDPRRTGSSSYTFRRLARHAFTMLTGFSTAPLRLATLIGFFSTLFGLAVLIFVLVSYLSAGHVVSGFPFLASIIAIFAGAQLLTLGILGEYLARVHMRVMDRPAYAVREEVGSKSQTM